MEGGPVAPANSSWEAAEQASVNNDILESRLVGIEFILIGWRSNPNSSLPDIYLSPDKKRERNDFQKWLNHDLKRLFQELKAQAARDKIERRVQFTVGEQDISAHRLDRMGSTGSLALYEADYIRSGSSLTLDYAQMHNVPQDADFDRVPGILESEQVYFGDTRQKIAVSLNQMAISLMQNGGLKLL
jgi:hypothetical protein